MRRMYSESELREFIRVHGNDVVQSLVGKDISVEGITSKGIANTGGLANIGNVAVSGNITTTGYVKADSYELDEDITISNLPQGLSCYYAHARISNGKLNVVIAFNTNTGGTTPATQPTKIGEVNLDESVLSKLHPYYQVYLASKVGKLCTSNTITDTDLIVQIRKDTENNKIEIYFTNKNEFAASYYADSRFEFNFMLS